MSVLSGKNVTKKTLIKSLKYYNLLVSYNGANKTMEDDRKILNCPI